MRTLLLCLFMIAIVDSGSCQPRTGGGDPGKPSKITSCRGDAISHCAPDLLGPVNECLSGTVDIVSCIGGFLKPAACTSVDFVACLVRHEGSAANARAQADPSNTMDARRAARAREYLQRIGAQFAPDPGN